jgi:hypothetical protein
MFDAEKTVSVTGTVKEFEWVNPHSWLRVTVDDSATGRAGAVGFRNGLTRPTGATRLAVRIA